MVYFIQNEDDFSIKIGYTSGDIGKRIKELNTGSSSHLRCVGMRKGGMGMESKIHSLFKNTRKKGEWFYFSPVLEYYIKSENICGKFVDGYWGFFDRYVLPIMNPVPTK